MLYGERKLKKQKKSEYKKQIRYTQKTAQKQNKTKIERRKKPQTRLITSLTQPDKITRKKKHTKEKNLFVNISKKKKKNREQTKKVMHSNIQV